MHNIDVELAGVAGIVGSMRVAGVAGIEVRLAVIEIKVVAGRFQEGSRKVPGRLQEGSKKAPEPKRTPRESKRASREL